MTSHAIRRVLVFPVNGYVNRLQAVASAAILARYLDAELNVCWVTSDIVPGPATDTFSPEFCRDHVVTSEQADEDLGVTLDSLPLYLSLDSGRGLIVLRGHDRGEQVFVEGLRDVLVSPEQPTTLVIVAGGSFYLDPEGRPERVWHEDFLNAKRDFYRSLRLAPSVADAAEGAVGEHSDGFLGLHLRYSDRAHQAPTERSIKRALAHQSGATGLKEVFIASDTPSGRDRWHGLVTRMGLRPWSIPNDVWDRSDVSSAAPALTDWLVLGRSNRLVYFAESSFAVEACVASGTWVASSALAVSRPRAFAYRAGVLARAAVTYPARHMAAR